MSKTRTIVIPDDLDAKVTALAVDGKTYSDIVRDALEMYFEIDQGILRTAKRFAVGLDLHPMHVLSNLAMARVGQLEAQREVFGPSSDLLFEFAKIGDSVIRGEKAYREIKAYYVRQYEQQKRLNSK